MVRSWFELFACLSLAIVMIYYGFWPGVFILLLVLVILAFYYNSWFYHFLTGFLLIVLFMLFMDIYNLPGSKQVEQTESSIKTEGKIISRPRWDNRKSSFVLERDAADKDARKIQVFAYFKTDLNCGDRVILKGTLTAPNSPGNPGEFDYRAYLHKEQIHSILTVESPENIIIIESGNGFSNYLYNYRTSFEKVVYDNIPHEEAAIILGMVLGKTDDITPERYLEFQQAGIAHLFSVSGLHVGFIVLLLGWLTAMAGFSKRSSLISSTVVLLIYATLVGWPVPVTRSVIMAVLAMLAYYGGRERQILDSLGLAGIVIYYLDPYALFKVSFQLSFLATGGILYFYPLMRDKWEVKSWLGKAVLIPLAAQLTTLPLIAYYFNLFTPVSIICNIVLLYLSGAIVILAFAALLVFEIIAPLGIMMLSLTGFLTSLLTSLTSLSLKIPGAYFWTATPHCIMLGLFFAGLGFIVFYWHCASGKKIMYLGLLLMIMFVVSICLPAGVFNHGQMELVFVDVGQGDCILIKTPQGKFILVDGGGSPYSDVGERKVIPYLRHRGIREFFMLINTHPDTDHLQGLLTVAEQIRFKYIGLPASLIDSERYTSLKEIADHKGAAVVPLFRGQRLNPEAEVYIDVVYPGPGPYAGDEFNSQSLVLEVQFRDFVFVLPGDLEEPEVSQIVPELKKAVLVKVPHHGSKGSLGEGFYIQTDPGLAVICTGKNNFGHPHQEVLDVLAKHDIKVYRTDLSGLISFKSDGHYIKTDTYRKSVQK